MSDVSINIEGLDKVQAALAQFPQEVNQAFQGAGQQVFDEVLMPTVGLQNYPAAGPGNAPPTPYYVRGQGTQYASYNKGNSERLGTQFYVEAVNYGAEIGNRASYADYVVGDRQATAMKNIGWRKLYEVAVEKIDQITEVYQKWVDRLIERLGL